MIRLDIQEYCHNCPSFSPQKDTTYLYENGKHTASDNVIFCEYSARCENIATYLKMKLAEEKKK